MPSTWDKVQLAATALAAVQAVGAQNNTSTVGPPWIQSEFDTSPAVYPSRECQAS